MWDALYIYFIHIKGEWLKHRIVSFRQYTEYLNPVLVNTLVFCIYFLQLLSPLVNKGSHFQKADCTMFICIQVIRTTWLFSIIPSTSRARWNRLRRTSAYFWPQPENFRVSCCEAVDRHHCTNYPESQTCQTMKTSVRSWSVCVCHRRQTLTEKGTGIEEYGCRVSQNGRELMMWEQRR